MEVGNVLVPVMLVILCCLAGMDLWRQVAIRAEQHLAVHYRAAVKHNYDFWKLGYRVEDLELKNEAQQRKLEKTLAALTSGTGGYISKNALRHSSSSAGRIEAIRESRTITRHLMGNDSNTYRIRCGGEGGSLLRVGTTDYRTDVRDMCTLFTSPDPEASGGAHMMFNFVEANEEGSVALRSVSTGLYMKTVPPPNDNSQLPWKLVVGGSSVGAAETFRVTSEGYLYSALLGGFFTCSNGGRMVEGFPGKFGSWSTFSLERVPIDDLTVAESQVALSDRIRSIQDRYAVHSIISHAERKDTIKAVTGLETTSVVKICIGVPITSKGTEMTEVADSPFWPNLFDSFMKSIDWRSNRFVFKFFLGFDRADSLYDTGDAWSEMREEFRHRAVYRMTEQLMEEAEINAVLESKLLIKLMHFDHLEGAPSQVVSQLMLAGFAEDFDYFYQVNDDTSIVSPNWATKLVETLAGNAFIPNFGVTGPVDSNNDKIFTHSFVHRTHFEIFGHLFPPYFKNWWSDDWITTVYGAAHTFRNPDVEISHNVGAQKTGGATRYEIDQSAQLHLDEELRRGHVQINQWLKKNSLPRLPLPVICGYVPAVQYLLGQLGPSPSSSTSSSGSKHSTISFSSSSSTSLLSRSSSGSRVSR